MTITEDPPSGPLNPDPTYFDLVPKELWYDACHRITEAHDDISEELAERLVNEAVAYLVLRTKAILETYWAPELVVIALKALAYDEPAFEKLCESLGSGIITIPDDQTPGNARVTTIAMKYLGVTFDPDLWHGCLP